MDYLREPLFPKYTGRVELPVLIPDVSGKNNVVFYKVVAFSEYSNKIAPPFHNFLIIKYDISRANPANEVVTVFEANKISDLAFKEFVFLEGGSFHADKLDLNSVPSNMRNAQRLVGKQLVNLSNIYAPLILYRLKRNSYSEKSTRNNYYKTNWDTRVMDHSENVPCARSGHSVLVDSKNNRLFLVGGVTVLADKDYQDNIEDIDNNWFYYPLNDVWKLDLETLEWERMMDLNFKPRRLQSKVPKVLSSGFKLPNLLTNIALVYDHKNNLIYCCYSPLECLDIVTERKHTYLISIDPLTQSLRRECTYNITGPSSLAIAYNYSKLVVQFPSLEKADVCIIPYTRMDKLKCALLNRNLLPRKDPRKFEISSSIRFICEDLFTLCAEFGQPIQDAHLPCVIAKASYYPASDFKLLNLLK